MAKGKKSKSGKKGKGKGGKSGGGVPKTDLNKRVKPQATAGQGPVIEVTDSSFDKIVRHSELPVLVDFWAPWCGPCKAIGPIVESIAEERKGQLRVVKYNTEANNHVASEMNIRSIPALVLFNNGDVADVKVGAASKVALIKWIDKTLNPKSGLMGRLFG